MPVRITIIFLCLCNSIFAQSRQGKPLEANSVISLTSKKGILYNGIDNVLSIDSSFFVNSDTLLVQTNNGVIVNDTCNRYLCIPRKIGTMWLTVYSVIKTDTLMLGFKYFSVQNIPDPLLTLNTRPISTPAKVSKNELMNCDSIGVYFTDDIEGSEKWMSVVDFSLGYSYGGFYVSHLNPSNKFTIETKAIINQMGPDKEISIRPTVRSEGKILRSLPIYKIRIY
jgi:hypothetical protein